MAGHSLSPPHPPTRRRSAFGDPPPPRRGEGEALWVSRGINGLAALVVEGKGLIPGGQPAGEVAFGRPWSDAFDSVPDEGDGCPGVRHEAD